MWLATLGWLAFAAPASGATWPADDSWEPIGGVGVIDPPADHDGAPGADIVGTVRDPAGSWTADDTTLYLRVRLAAPPADRALHALIEADGDLGSGSWDVGLVLDGRSGELRLGGNTDLDASWCADRMDAVAATYPAPADGSGHARIVDAGTTLGGGDDVFLDLQVPLADLAALTGVDDPSLLDVVFATSQSSRHVDQDVGGGECGWTWADTFAPDGDGDGLADGDELDLGSDPDDADTDNDGIADGDEVRTTRTDPLDPDSDDGGTKDGDELDAGRDPRDGADDLADRDGDGLSDDDELAIGADPDRADTDGDGLDDGDEIALGADPRQPDTDGDGLPDGREHELGADPTRPDTDGGGASDGDEVALGTDPLDDADDARIDTAAPAAESATCATTGGRSIVWAALLAVGIVVRRRPVRAGARPFDRREG